MSAIEQLLDIMRRLRDRDSGCPWDLEQNFHTIAPFTIEEAYEVADAIEREDMPELKDELGDLLFQVVYHSQLASELSEFRFDDVVAAITDKIIRRHPHVFGEPRVHDAATQSGTWERIKADERRRKAGATEPSALDGVSRTLPALTRSVKLQKRAARLGFDWDAVDGIFDKIREEMDEVRAEIESDAAQESLEDEVGDLLFACSNLARFLRVDPEVAMRRANAKFERRFRAMEAALRAQDRTIDQASMDELEAQWQAAKRAERG